MTHHKIAIEGKHSFSPVSLKDAERFARLEKNLEAVIRQNGKAVLPESFEERDLWSPGDKAVSPAIRNSIPDLWIFGLKLTTPCV
jgi:hypothetical protein